MLTDAFGASKLALRSTPEKLTEVASGKLSQVLAAMEGSLV